MDNPTHLPFQHLLPSSQRTTRSRKDWHVADIIAAVKKKGITVAALSRMNNMSSSTLANALTRPWPKGEIIIAEAIGIKPDKIWPTRYFKPDGTAITRKTRASNKI